VARSHLRSLTGLRFIAALQVLVFHCTGWQSWRVPTLVRNIAGSGYVAVSLFFVLSGFILTYVHAGSGAAPLDRRDFYAGRFARIYPAYVFALAIAAPFFVVHTIRVEGAAEFFKQAVAVVALMQAYVPSLAMAWNPPAWSLSAEAFFYALFPIVAPRLVACRRSTALSVGVMCYALCLAAPLVYMMVAPDAPIEPTHESTAFWLRVLRYNPVVRFPEFVIGIVVGRWYLDGIASRRSNDRAALWSLAAAIALSLVLSLSSSIPYPILHNGLLAPLYALLIASLATGRGPVAALLATRPLVALGEASYSLYVLHLPLMILWKNVIVHGGGARYWGTWACTAAFLALAVVASLLCYRYIEVPLRGVALAALRKRAPRLALDQR
jgi:peptidoglycan/LPS O-acetylase OafA/YrhL